MEIFVIGLWAIAWCTCQLYQPGRSRDVVLVLCIVLIVLVMVVPVLPMWQARVR